jgi:hypothetical protein
MGAPSPQSRQKSAVPSCDVMNVAAARLGVLGSATPALWAERAVLLADPAAAPAIIEMPRVNTLRRFIPLHLRIEIGIPNERFD